MGSSASRGPQAKTAAMRRRGHSSHFDLEQSFSQERSARSTGSGVLNTSVLLRGGSDETQGAWRLGSRWTRAANELSFSQSQSSAPTTQPPTSELSAIIEDEASHNLLSKRSASQEEEAITKLEPTIRATILGRKSTSQSQPGAKRFQAAVGSLFDILAAHQKKSDGAVTETVYWDEELEEGGLLPFSGKAAVTSPFDAAVLRSKYTHFAETGAESKDGEAKNEELAPMRFVPGAQVLVNAKKQATINDFLGSGQFGQQIYSVNIQDYSQTPQLTNRKRAKPGTSHHRVSTMVYYPAKLMTNEFKYRMFRELLVLNHIRHLSHVPKIEFLCSDENTPECAIAFIKGTYKYITLESYMDKGEGLLYRDKTEAEIAVGILKICYQVAKGLSSLHLENFVHQDVKPANLLINPRTLHVLLTNFTLTREAISTKNGNIQVEFAGYTATYRSPEQEAIANRIQAVESVQAFNEVRSHHLVTPQMSDAWAFALTVLQIHCTRVIWQEGQGETGPIFYRTLVEKKMGKEASSVDLSAELSPGKPDFTFNPLSRRADFTSKGRSKSSDTHEEHKGRGSLSGLAGMVASARRRSLSDTSKDPISKKRRWTNEISEDNGRDVGRRRSSLQSLSSLTGAIAKRLSMSGNKDGSLAQSRDKEGDVVRVAEKVNKESSFRMNKESSFRATKESSFKVAKESPVRSQGSGRTTMSNVFRHNSSHKSVLAETDPVPTIYQSFDEKDDFYDCYPMHPEVIQLLDLCFNTNSFSRPKNFLEIVYYLKSALQEHGVDIDELENIGGNEIDFSLKPTSLRLKSSTPTHRPTPSPRHGSPRQGNLRHEGAPRLSGTPGTPLLGDGKKHLQLQKRGSGVTVLQPIEDTALSVETRKKMNQEVNTLNQIARTFNNLGIILKSSVDDFSYVEDDLSEIHLVSPDMLIQASVECFNMALLIDSEDSSFLQNLADAMCLQGKFVEAQKLYKKCKAFEHSGHLQVNFALALERHGQQEKALEAYKRAMDIFNGNSGVLSNCGMILMERGQFSEAEHLLEQALQSDANNQHIGYNLGLLYYHTEHYSEAIEMFESGLEQDPHDFDIVCSLAMAFAKCGRMSDAINTYRKAVTMRSSNNDALYNLGHCLMQERLWGEALAVFYQVVKKDAYDVDAYNNMGNIHSELGQVTKAIECYREAHRIEPMHPATLFNLAHALLEDEQFNEALSVLHQTVVIQPSDGPIILARIFQAYMKLNRKEDALAYIDSYLADTFEEGVEELKHEMSPRVNAIIKLAATLTERKEYEIACELYNYALEDEEMLQEDGFSENIKKIKESIAKVYSDWGKYDEAASIYREMLAHKENDVSMIVSLGQVLRKMGCYLEALDVLEKGNQLEPHNPEVLGALANAYSESDDHESSLEKYEELLDLHPRDPTIRNNLGCLLMVMGRMPEAAEQFRKACAYEPNNTGSTYNLAYVLQSMGDHANAIEIYHKCLLQSPNDTELLLNMADAFLSTNKYAEAIETLVQLKQLIPESKEVRKMLLLAERKKNGEEDRAYLSFIGAVHSLGATRKLRRTSLNKEKGDRRGSIAKLGRSRGNSIVSKLMSSASSPKNEQDAKGDDRGGRRRSSSALAFVSRKLSISSQESSANVAKMKSGMEKSLQKLRRRSTKGSLKNAPSPHKRAQSLTYRDFPRHQQPAVSSLPSPIQRKSIVDSPAPSDIHNVLFDVNKQRFFPQENLLDEKVQDKWDFDGSSPPSTKSVPCSKSREIQTSRRRQNADYIKAIKSSKSDHVFFGAEFSSSNLKEEKKVQQNLSDQIPPRHNGPSFLQNDQETFSAQDNSKVEEDALLHRDSVESYLDDSTNSTQYSNDNSHSSTALLLYKNKNK